MLTPSSITIPQNGSGTVVVSTVLIDGASQLVTFSVQNIPTIPPPGFFPTPLPPGAKVWFAPPVAPIGTDTTLTIQVANVVPGTYLLNIQAVGEVFTANDTLTLIVTESTFSV